MKKFFSSLFLCALLSAPALAADNVIISATNPTWPPMQMLDLDKNIIGYEIDIVKAAAAEVGLEVKMVATEWDGIFAFLEARQADLLSSCVTITEQRQKRYLFSDPCYEFHQSLIVPNGSSIAKFEDLKGKTVGIQIGTSAGFALNKSGVDMNIKTYDDIGLVFEDMKNGRLDAVMCDEPVGLYYANRKEGFTDLMKLAFLTEETESIGFVFLQSNAELRDKFNQGIKAIRENGKEAEIQKKWFGTAQ